MQKKKTIWFISHLNGYVVSFVFNDIVVSISLTFLKQILTVACYVKKQILRTNIDVSPKYNVTTRFLLLYKQ